MIVYTRHKNRCKPAGQLAGHNQSTQQHTFLNLKKPPPPPRALALNLAMEISCFLITDVCKLAI